MRNVVIALVISLVVVGGVIAFVMSKKNDLPGVPDPRSERSENRENGGIAKPRPHSPIPPSTPRALVRVEVAVTTEKGEPVANARVRIDSEELLRSGRRDIAPVAEFLTNASGLGVPRDKLETGAYVVWAEASGYARARQVLTVTKSEEPVKVTMVLTSGVAISGRVVAAKDRTPIKGARVVAFKDLGREGGGDIDWLMDLLEPKTLEKPLSADVTDAEGSYSLAGLQAGVKCVVRVAADGYSPGSKGYVAAGTPNVNFELETGGRLTGQILASNGAAVSGAKVEAYRKSGSSSDIREAVRDAMGGAIDAVITGGDGSFVFAALGQGTFRLIASAPGHQEGTQDIDLKLGVEATVRITLDDGLVLAGKVVGPDGSPVPKARVSVRPQASASGGDSAIVRENEQEVETDAAGKFSFDSLTAGQHTVTVSHEELAAAQLRDVTVPQENLEIALNAGAAVMGKVTDSQGNPVDGVRMSVQDVGSVTKEAITADDGTYVLRPLSVKPINKKQVQAEKEGWARPEPQTASLVEDTATEVNFVLVRNARVEGTVKDSWGKPIEGARVFVEKMITKENPVSRFLGNCVTNTQGAFDLPTIVPSTAVRLVVEHPYYTNWSSEPFDINAGDNLADTVVTLETGASITGEVVNEEGAKLAKADVKAVKPGDPDTRDFLGGNSAKTDEQGRFTLQGLGSGRYEIVARVAGYLEGRSEPIELAEGASRSGVGVRLVTARTVSGTIVDARGKAVAGARITATDASQGTRKESGVSGEDGGWTIGGLGAEPVEIQAEAEGYAKQTLRDVPTGKGDVRIQMMSLGGVKGVVVDTEGKPVKAFSAKAEPVDVEAGYETPRTSFKTFSGSEGAFELGSLPPGAFTINVQSPGYRGTLAANIRVAASEITDVGTLTLQAGGALRGRVLDANGAPVPDASVSVIGGASRFASTRGGKTETTVTTDAAGQFVFESLKGGPTKFRATRAGFLPAESDSVDPNNLTGELVITMGTSGQIAGIVVNGRKEALANVKVYLKSDTKSAQTSSDAQGRFAFDELPEGKYTVRTFSFVKPGEERPQEAVLDVDVAAGQTTEVELVKN